MRASASAYLHFGMLLGNVSHDYEHPKDPVMGLNDSLQGGLVSIDQISFFLEEDVQQGFKYRAFLSSKGRHG